MESYDIYVIAIVCLLGAFLNLVVKDEDIRYGVNSIVIIYMLGYMTRIVLQYVYS